jgi:hypothetical protein
MTDDEWDLAVDQIATAGLCVLNLFTKVVHIATDDNRHLRCGRVWTTREYLMYANAIPDGPHCEECWKGVVQ